jgi:hypothetical protein
MVLIFAPHPHVSAPIVFATALLWAVLGFESMWYLASREGWSDRYRCAASFGTTLSCMLPGYLSLAGWTRPDLFFKIVTNIGALFCFLFLARRIHSRPEHPLQEA